MSFSQVLAAVQDQPTRTAARMVAESGVPVFPCVPGGKRPLTRHGFLDATTSPSQVAAWWRQYPGANIGVPTGAASGVDVVDIDLRDGTDGHVGFDRASRRVDTTGWMAQVATPSGGTHLYYPADPVRPQSSWACGAAHVDFRGAGGYIITPPSMIDTGQGAVGYRLVRVHSDAHPVDADRLRTLLDPDLVQRRVQVRVGRADPGLVDGSRLASWVATRPVGERNQGLFWATCRLAEAGHTIGQAYALLADPAHDAGLRDREIHTTITSAYRHAHPSPDPVPASPHPTPAGAVCEAVTL